MYWRPRGPGLIFSTLPVTESMSPIFLGASEMGMQAAAAMWLRKRSVRMSLKAAKILFRRFHAQGVVEAVEIVEQTDGGGQFDDLSFIEMGAQLGPQGVVHTVGIAGHAFGQAQGGFFRL